MSYPTITGLPPAPQRSDTPAQFDVKANNWVAAIDEFTVEVNAAGDYVETTAAQVGTDKAEILVAQENALNASASAVAGANYKGEWSTLTGAYNVPTSVSHESVVWLLKENVTNIAIEEPGISAKWQRIQEHSNSLGTSRTRLMFRSAYDVYVLGTNFYMDGFRFQGFSYKQTTLQGNNPVALTGGSGAMSVAAVTTGNREYLSTLQLETWYAAFACLNFTTPDQDCIMKTVPFLRVHSVVGNKVYLAGNMGRASTQTYAPPIGDIANLTWDSASLVGKEVLICSETFPGGRLNHPSGRVTTITAADNESVTLADAGTLGAFDYILPAPTLPYYHYCGSFYIDSAEVMNFADSGTHVGTRSINIRTDTPSGAVTTGTDVNCYGQISPLATAIIFNNSVQSYLRTPFGFNEDFQDNGDHTVASIGGDFDTFRAAMVTVPFIFGQRFEYKTSGSDAQYRHSHAMLVLGYIEP